MRNGKDHLTSFLSDSQEDCGDHPRHQHPQPLDCFSKLALAAIWIVQEGMAVLMPVECKIDPYILYISCQDSNLIRMSIFGRNQPKRVTFSASRTAFRLTL
jgi:hypothetical protein